MRISEENKFLVKVVIALFLGALVSYIGYLLVGFRHQESRVDGMLDTLDSYYSGQRQAPPDREQFRHTVIDLLEEKQRDSALEELLLHLSEALGIAGVLVVGVDFTMRNLAKRETDKRTEEVNRAIWRALLRRFVPSSIAEEIEGILKSDVCRVRPRYIVRILRDTYRDIPPGHVVVRRELTYGLKNLTPESIPAYPIRVRMDSTLRANVKDANGKDVSMPGMRMLTIQGKQIEIADPSDVVSNTRLQKMGSDYECVTVYSVAEELLPRSGQATYIITVPCVGIEVMVFNELRDEIAVKEVYLTGGWVDKLVSPTPDVWTCEAGVLPGTVLVISWEEIPVTRPAATVAD